MAELFDQNEYILYETEEIEYKNVKYLGCRSRNFLPEGWQMITLERLFQNMCGQSLYKSIYSIADYKARLAFIVEQTERMTGLKNFGSYMSRLLTIDTLFLKEDRHTHNIAVLIDDTGTFSSDFDEQLDIAEELYGQTLHFTYTEKDIQKLLERDLYYPEEIKQRVYAILMIQKRKYQYLFRKCRVGG